MTPFHRSPAARPPRPAPAASPEPPRRPVGSLLAVVAVLAIALTAAGAIVPQGAAAATTYAARCDGTALRTKPWVSATKKAAIPAGTTVAAVAKVTGGRWRTTCDGATASGNTWLRITIVSGRTASSRYGVTYVYGAYGLFRYVSPTTTLQAVCDGTALRTKPYVSATRKASIPAGARVTVVATVAGGSWSTTCRGYAQAGTNWYRISAVNGRSASSLYGVPYVYGARALFGSVTTESTAARPTPTPTPKPTPTPTPKPTSTPTPTPTPTSTPAPTPAPSTAPSASPTAAPDATPSASPSASPSPSAGSGYREGIDVSHWQGPIDWTAVAGAGKQFAFLKATESTSYLDPTYATHRAQAKAAGLKVGAYHFARPSTTAGDAAAEAEWFVQNATPASGELLPVLDLEVTGGLSVAQLQDWTRAFMDRVYELTGVRGAIYVSPSFWSTYVGNTTSLAVAGYRTLWVAHWTTATRPTVPGSNWNGNGWTFWQYTSSGTVPGIAGNVDLDRYRFGDWTPVLVP